MLLGYARVSTVKRSLIRERTQAGLAAARRAGRCVVLSEYPGGPSANIRTGKIETISPGTEGANPALSSRKSSKTSYNLAHLAGPRR
jgi:hypothetical protein